ncbi:MAG: hypothetical protein GY714_27720 [Desulfobacterales bacterium]|nr:hypothetical protein [Desulfobacterales bacterium]MCP4163539.1 hypothetical protein [Deltaproteobacteria bacterium]
MGIKYIIDKEKKIIFVKRFGAISPEEFINGMLEITAHKDFSKANKLYSDMSVSNLSTLSLEELNQYARFCGEKLNQLLIIVVVPQNLNFGVSRLFETLLNQGNIKFVKEKTDALRWLDINCLPDDFQ